MTKRFMEVHRLPPNTPNFACDFCGGRFHSNTYWPSCTCEAGSNFVRRIEQVIPEGPPLIPWDFPVPVPVGMGGMALAA